MNSNLVSPHINALFLLRCIQIIIPTTINAIGDNNINPLFSYPKAYNPVNSIGSPNTLNPGIKYQNLTTL